MGRCLSLTLLLALGTLSSCYDVLSSFSMITFLSYLAVFCFVQFGCCQLEAFFFFKWEAERDWDHGKRGCNGSWEKCSQDLLSERVHFQ